MTRLPGTRRQLGVHALAPALLFVLVPLFGTPGAAHAQAWLAPAGEATVVLSLELNKFDGHLSTAGDEIPLGPSTARSLLLLFDYGLSERWAISFSVPYVSTRNDRDPSPVAGRTGIDDGDFHSTLQDYRFEARYGLLTTPLALTPFVRYILPSHDYETEAEAAPGRNLEQFLAGVYAARLLDPILPDAYLHAMVSYAWVEKSLGISTDRINVDLSFGYFVTPALAVSLFGNYQKTHGGLTGDAIFGGRVSHEEFVGHDRLVRQSYRRAGLGASLALSRDWSVSAAYATVVSGSDSHYGDTYVLAVQRRFELGRP